MSKETTIDEVSAETSQAAIDGYSETDSSTTPSFGMSAAWAENVVDWFEEQHKAIQKGLGPNNSLVVGLAGILIFSWLGSLLVVQAIPDIRFGVRTFHRVARPTKLSSTLEKTYWALSSKEFASYSLSKKGLSHLPSKQAKLLHQMMKQLRHSRPALSRKLRRSITIGQATQLLRTYLQKDRPRARSYLAFYLRNVFRPRALHLDMAILLTRSMLLGFLMLFSIRLFFEDTQTSKD